MNKKIKIMMLSAIFIGGFASLATELIALRQLSTFVGSTTAITSIIIGVIMLFMLSDITKVQAPLYYKPD